MRAVGRIANRFLSAQWLMTLHPPLLKRTAHSSRKFPTLANFPKSPVEAPRLRRELERFLAELADPEFDEPQLNAILEWLDARGQLASEQDFCGA